LGGGVVDFRLKRGIMGMFVDVVAVELFEMVYAGESLGFVEILVWKGRTAVGLYPCHHDEGLALRHPRTRSSLIRLECGERIGVTPTSLQKTYEVSGADLCSCDIMGWTLSDPVWMSRDG